MVGMTVSHLGHSSGADNMQAVNGRCHVSSALKKGLSHIIKMIGGHQNIHFSCPNHFCNLNVAPASLVAVKAPVQNKYSHTLPQFHVETGLIVWFWSQLVIEMGDDQLRMIILT